MDKATHEIARKLAQESQARADNEGFLARAYLDLWTVPAPEDRAGLAEAVTVGVTVDTEPTLAAHKIMTKRYPLADFDSLHKQLTEIRATLDAIESSSRPAIIEECARVAETYDPHIGNPGYERAITGSIAAAIRALAHEGGVGNDLQFRTLL